MAQYTREARLDKQTARFELHRIRKLFPLHHPEHHPEPLFFTQPAYLFAFAYFYKGMWWRKRPAGSGRGALQVGSREHRVLRILSTLKLPGKVQFLLPTPHLLRLYHLLSFFPVLSGFVSVCRSYGQAGPHAQRVNAQSKFPP